MSEPRAPSFSPISRSSSPLSEYSDAMMQAFEAERQESEALESANGGHTNEGDDSLFVTPGRTRFISLPIRRLQRHPTKAITKLTGPAADREKNRRATLHRAAYESLIAGINKRNMQRKYLDTRNRIWDDSSTRAKRRIRELEKEKAALMNDLKDGVRAREEFNRANRVAVSSEKEMEVKEMYEMYFALEIDELDVDELEEADEEIVVKTEEVDEDEGVGGVDVEMEVEEII